MAWGSVNVGQLQSGSQCHPLLSCQAEAG